ncbi:MAG: sensor histidine kinase [Verrucomicrobia bacterium]|nr:sensor histidine kinase [Verrucomicrobiota bacterium]
MAEKITAIERLEGSEIAVAVRKKGLFILSKNGKLLRSLTSPEYEDINDVAAREPGILWISTYRGIEKVYYGSPVSIVDQRINVVGNWPLVVNRGAKTLIAASGQLYEPAATPQTNATITFRPVPGLGSNWAQTIAASGTTLIVGNNQGAFAVKEGQPHEQILHNIEVEKLAMLTPDICLAIGSKQITALRNENGHWVEGFDRIPGYGFAYLTYRAKNSVWIEYGVNRVARISIQAGKLHSQIIENFPWKDPRWVNIGIIDNLVVLTGPLNGRAFFDEDTETFCDAPIIKSVLQESPYWISRVAQDNTGTIWGSHEQGVVRFIKSENGYTCDRTTMELIRDRHPSVQVVNGSDVWLSTGTVLYHVDSNSQYTKPAEAHPVLASVNDVRTGIQIFGPEQEASLCRIPYSQNSLSFRFFAGSYRLQIPTYEFRMHEKSSNWAVLGSDSLLTLPNLREGSYQFEVRLADSRGPVGIPLTIIFEITPPWYRTWLALFAYITTGAAAIAGLVAWFGYRARLRTTTLEKLVGERTEALRLTMEKLHEETRNAATLEERGRLANEIHDSVQQGLSGLILQLDSTLKFSALDKETRSRIDVARKMVAFTREEVRHALWDMESTLLEHTELGDALNRMSMVVSSGTAQIDIQVSGEPALLTQSTKHHLLRIAQEAMTNAVRYSKAERIRVELACNEDLVSLSVIDNGIGFQIDSAPTYGMGHFGLRSIRTRAGKIGGDLKIHSEPNHGTSVIVTVPTTRSLTTPPNADSKQG